MKMTGSVTIIKRNQMMGAFTTALYFVSEPSSRPHLSVSAAPRRDPLLGPAITAALSEIQPNTAPYC